MKCGNPVLVFVNGDGGRYFRHFDLTKKEKLPNAWQVFNCGKCLHCRKKRSYELACRCVLHASLHKRNCFLTLTYDESQNGYHNNFEYADIQKFKKRLRRKYQHKKIEIFNVHEYGHNGKKHWHLVVFNHDFADKTLHTTKNGIPLYKSETLQKLWPHGFSSIGDVTEASAMYQSQYMEKDFRHGYVTDKKSIHIKKSHSKHSGIGKNYFLKHYKQILKLGYIPVSGKKMPIPRYFEKLAEKMAVQGHSEFNELLQAYKLNKSKKIEEMEKEWDEVISQHLTTNRDPDFLLSLQNTAHDLKNKLNKGSF